MAKLMQVEQYRRATSESELLADGWHRRFVTDQERLADAIETYEEMGMEVALLPVELDDQECGECMKSGDFLVIYTRRCSQ